MVPRRECELPVRCTSPNGNAGWSSVEWSHEQQNRLIAQQMADSEAGRWDLDNPLCKNFGRRIALSLLSPGIFSVCLKRLHKKWVSVGAAKSSKGMADFALRVGSIRCIVSPTVSYFRPGEIGRRGRGAVRFDIGSHCSRPNLV